MEKEYLKCAEVAELLRVSPKTVNRWAREGRLPHSMTMGGHRRYLRRDIEALVGKSKIWVDSRVSP